MITKAGEDPDFFIMPDIGVELAQIDNDTTDDADEKRAAKRSVAK